MGGAVVLNADCVLALLHPPLVLLVQLAQRSAQEGLHSSQQDMSTPDGYSGLTMPSASLWSSAGSALKTGSCGATGTDTPVTDSYTRPTWEPRTSRQSAQVKITNGANHRGQERRLRAVQVVATIAVGNKPKGVDHANQIVNLESERDEPLRTCKQQLTPTIPRAVLVIPETIKPLITQ